MVMVNEPVIDPEAALALSYAPPRARVAVDALFALDARLRHIVAVARDPTIGLMRLTWWGDALAKLDAAPAPAEPLLRALAAAVLPGGVAGATLATMVDGWARLLEADPIDLDAYARERGGTLFAAAARLLGSGDARIGPAGEAWGLADLARLRDDCGVRARDLASERLARLYARPWPRALRALGALGLVAGFDRGRPGSPRRVARLMMHRLTGR